MTIKIEKEFENQRIDKALATITSKSRMNILKLIEDGNIKINNNPVKASRWRFSRINWRRAKVIRFRGSGFKFKYRIWGWICGCY